MRTSIRTLWIVSLFVAGCSGGTVSSGSSSSSSTATSSSSSGSSSSSSSGSSSSSSGSSSSSSGTSSATSSSSSASSSGSTGSSGSSGGGFTTNLTQNMTIVPPFDWSFDPGVPSVHGTFWADGARIDEVDGGGPYAFTIVDGLLAPGAHLLGHSWDFADGGHQPGPTAFHVTIAELDGGAPDAGTPMADGGINYEQAIAYSNTPPAFTPARTVVVTSQSELQNAINNLQPGDYVDCQGAFTVSGEFVIDSALSGVAVIDFKSGANAVRFVGPAGQNLPALWINGASHVHMFGGDFTTQSTGGTGILIYDADDVMMWGFYIHDCGASGLSMLTVGTIVNTDLQGEITNCGLNLNWDPHAEKGTGLHGAILADGHDSTVSFSNNRLALYVHDQPSGAGVEIGEDPTIADFSGNVLYLKAVNLTFVATSQVAGNALQVWGASGLGLDVKYLEAQTCAGRGVDGAGFYSSTNGTGITVEYGAANDMCLGGCGHESGISSTEPWDTRWGITYEDVSPLP